MFHSDPFSLLTSSLLRNIPNHVDRLWNDAILALLITVLPHKPEGLINLMMYVFFITLVLSLMKDVVTACLTGDWSFEPYYVRERKQEPNALGKPPRPDAKEQQQQEARKELPEMFYNTGYAG